MGIVELHLAFRISALKISIIDTAIARMERRRKKFLQQIIQVEILNDQTVAEHFDSAY